jgi:hypothetical protein
MQGIGSYETKKNQHGGTETRRRTEGRKGGKENEGGDEEGIVKRSNLPSNWCRTLPKNDSLRRFRSFFFSVFPFPLPVTFPAPGPISHFGFKQTA